MKASQNGHAAAEETQRLLGPTGRPIDRGGRDVEKELIGSLMSFGAGDYIQSLVSADLPVLTRAQDPFSFNTWASTAASLAATVTIPAVPTIFRETEDQVDERKRQAKAAGRAFVSRHGDARRAMLRHDICRQRGLQRYLKKGIEPDYEHPLVELFEQPNEILDGSQFQILLWLWLKIRGEACIVLSMEDGGPAVLDRPERMWIVSPDSLEPRFEGGWMGRFIGWRLTTPRWMPDASVRGRQIDLLPEEVVQVKIPDPQKPWRGMSPLRAAAGAIEADLLVQTNNRWMIKNDATPRGMIVFEGDPPSEKDRERFLEKWKDEHQGPENTARLAALWGAFKWQQLGLPPKDMEYATLKVNARDEILAAMMTSASALGVQNVDTYAAALARDRAYWERSILPPMKMIERAFDRVVFFSHPDTEFFGYDVSAIDALRLGLDDQLAQMERLCGDKIHMDPKSAAKVVGLDIPSYIGDDVAFVPALATPVEIAIDLANEPPAPAAPPGAPGDTPPGMPPEDQPQDTEELPTPVGEGDGEDTPDREAATRWRGGGLTRTKRTRKKGLRWRDFIRVQSRIETRFRSAYLRWARADRTETLARFDREARGEKAFSPIYTKAIDLSVVLPIPSQMQAALKSLARPIYAGAYQSTWDLTADELGGIPTFEFDAPRFLRYFQMHEANFLEHTPRAIFDNLRTSLLQGVQAGETIQQLRERIGQVYKLSTASPKTLLIARTQTAGFMNGIRKEMFAEAEVEKKDWGTAGDEIVRDDHVTLGNAEAKPLEYNYLEIIGGSGVLEQPGDIRAEIKQTANCRCILLIAA